MITDRHRVPSWPNLVGNAPDWDAVRQIADRHGLSVVEDSCDALGATVAGHPHGCALDSAVTSFAIPTSSPAPGTVAWCPGRR